MSLYDAATRLPLVGGIVHGLGGNTTAENAQQNAFNTAAADQKKYQAYQLATLMNGYQPGVAAAFSPMQSFMQRWYGAGSTPDVGAMLKGVNPGSAQLSNVYSAAFGGDNANAQNAAMQAERQAGQSYSDAEANARNAGLFESHPGGDQAKAQEQMLEAERNYSQAAQNAANSANKYFNGETAFWGPNSGFQAPPAFTPQSSSVNALPDFWKGALPSQYKTAAGY